MGPTLEEPSEFISITKNGAHFLLNIEEPFEFQELNESYLDDYRIGSYYQKEKYKYFVTVFDENEPIMIAIINRKDAGSVKTLTNPFYSFGHGK